MKKLWLEASELLKIKDYDAAIPILTRAIRNEERGKYQLSPWPTIELAKVYHRQGSYAQEQAILECFLSKQREYEARHQIPQTESSWQKEMQDRLRKSQALTQGQTGGQINESGRGKCECCDKDNRVLTTIESGQWVCKTCLREIRGPARPKNLASPKVIESLRQRGYQLADNATKEEAQWIARVDHAKKLGLNITEHTSREEMDKAFASYTKTFVTKVAGARHLNQDGTDRQVVISRCRVGESLQLIREPENPHNKRAVRICRQNGEQLGYLWDDVVGNDQGIGWCVANHMDKGTTYEVVIKEIDVATDQRQLNSDDGWENLDVVLQVTYHPFRGGG